MLTLLTQRAALKRHISGIHFAAEDGCTTTLREQKTRRDLRKQMQNRQNVRQRREKLHHLVSHFTFDWVLTKWVRFDLFWCRCNAPTCLVFYLWRWPTHTHDWGFFFISCPDSLLSDNDNFQEPAFSEWSEAKLPLFQATLRSPRLKQSQVCLHLKSSHQNTSCLIPMLNEHIEPTFTKLFLCVFFVRRQRTSDEQQQRLSGRFKLVINVMISSVSVGAKTLADLIVRWLPENELTTVPNFICSSSKNAKQEPLLWTDSFLSGTYERFIKSIWSILTTFLLLGFSPQPKSVAVCLLAWFARDHGSCCLLLLQLAFICVIYEAVD